MVAVNPDTLTQDELRFVRHIGLKTDVRGCNVKKVKGSHLCVKTENENVIIEYSKLCEFYRGLALLKEEFTAGEIKEQPAAFDMLGAFIDCSRNAVPTVEMLKDYILDLASLGYNQLQLYTEDTFEIKDYPYFGLHRGRYTAEEIRELDAFSKLYGIELVPAVQTLAHLNAIFRWYIFEDIHDVDDILLCGDQKTYDFLDSMFASLRSMYSTDKVNIGMDEAHMMGLGKYLDQNGYRNRMDIFLEHIGRVVDILHKYGFKPMMWSDMYFKLFSQNDRLHESRGVTFDKKILEMIPEDMSLACWNYWVQPEGWYQDMIETHVAMGRDLIFTGGFQKWTGFCPTTHHSLRASRQGLEAVENCGVRKVLLTGWGDDGAEGSAYLMLPGLALYAEKCYIGKMDDEAVDYRLKVLFGRGLEDFYLLEEVHAIPDCTENEEVPPRNLNKILLWNDPILGLYDRHILPGTDEHLRKTAELLKKKARTGDRFDYVFETVYYLCRFLELKSEIGNNMREAYKSGNTCRLREIKDSVPQMIERLDSLHRVFRNNWLRENKIFGFDAQDIRFGAQRARLVYTKETLESYLNGEAASIPELEEPTLYMDVRGENEIKSLHFCTQNWRQVVGVSPN